jgi:site-specific DNA-methyltransferase (adenine-specific)
MTQTTQPNTLYIGDNLDTLRVRAHLADESIDLVCLIPPFNSKRDYKQCIPQNSNPDAGRIAQRD